MPDTPPTAAQVWEGKITFFSIDTDLIQAAGFNFTQGALHQLPRQLPALMGLQLTEVVVKEIVNHRMRPVAEAIHQFQSASEKLARLVDTDLTEIKEKFISLDVGTFAETQFQTQIREYAERCRGGILPIAGSDAAADLFTSYFAEDPPFAERRDNKSEFPDAMSLWLLERFASDNDTMGVVASQDDGWKQYAKSSERLYSVRSIDELAALFAATTEHAEEIKNKIAAAINDPDSPLRAKLMAELNHHVGNSEWDAIEVYSGSGRVDAEVYETEVIEYSISDVPNIWPMEDDPATWVVELTAAAKVNVDISVEFFAWDSIDREEVGIGSNSFTVVQEVDVEVYLTCSDVHLDQDPESWQIEVEIANARYSVKPFEAEMDFSDE
ncbi:PIN domain-containing protein [Variovorax sp. UC74_104]|uniref:PIN domain-containing protein n=1 Tax=Variovorax sp. UC74_104 TaxID=3374555 RepID=UPI003757704C